MTYMDLSESAEDSRMDLSGLFSYVWEGRKIILAMIGVFLVIGLIKYQMTPREYEASALFSAAPGSSEGVSTSGSALSGAARLFGFGGGASGAEFTKFQALLTSYVLAQRLAADPGLLQQMFAAQWDKKTQSWKAPSGIVATIKGAVGSIFGVAQKREAPGAQNVLSFLHANLDQDLSLQTSLLTITLRSPDPQFAKMLLSTVHREADNILRDAARTRAQRRIEYIEQTLKQVNAVEQRQVLIDLLNQEEQNSMMVQSDPNYAADVVDPPNVSPTPVSPILSVYLIASILAGLIFGLLLYVLLRSFNLHDIRLGWNPVRWPEAIAQHVQS